MVWACTILTKTNALSTVEGGRPWARMHQMHRYLHMLRAPNPSKVSGERTDWHMYAGLLFEKSCDLHVK